MKVPLLSSSFLDEYQILVMFPKTSSWKYTCKHIHIQQVFLRTYAVSGNTLDKFTHRHTVFSQRTGEEENI